jgi:hypothetical protein
MCKNISIHKDMKYKNVFQRWNFIHTWAIKYVSLQ